MTDQTNAPAGVVSRTEFGPVARVAIVPYEGGRRAKVLRAIDERLGNKEPWIVRAAEGTLLYDAETVRAIVEGAWCAGYYNAGYTNDSAYAEKQAEAFADAFLLPNTERSGAERPTGALSCAACGPHEKGNDV